MMSRYNPTMLKEIREVLGWSLRDLVEKCQLFKLDVTAQTLNNWENGESVPDADKLAVLAGVFGVGIERFYQNEGGK